MGVRRLSANHLGRKITVVLVVFPHTFEFDS